MMETPRRSLVDESTAARLCPRPSIWLLNFDFSKEEEQKPFPQRPNLPWSRTPPSSRSCTGCPACRAGTHWRSAGGWPASSRRSGEPPGMRGGLLWELLPYRTERIGSNQIYKMLPASRRKLRGGWGRVRRKSLRSKLLSSCVFQRETLEVRYMCVHCSATCCFKPVRIVLFVIEDQMLVSKVFFSLLNCCWHLWK